MARKALTGDARAPVTATGTPTQCFCEPRTRFLKTTQLEFITKVDTSATIEPYTLTKRCCVAQRGPPKAAETKV